MYCKFNCKMMTYTGHWAGGESDSYHPHQMLSLLRNSCIFQLLIWVLLRILNHDSAFSLHRPNIMANKPFVWPWFLCWLLNIEILMEKPRFFTSIDILWHRYASHCFGLLRFVNWSYRDSSELKQLGDRQWQTYAKHALNCIPLNVFN